MAALYGVRQIKKSRAFKSDPLPPWLVRAVDRVVYRAPVRVQIYLHETATSTRYHDPELVALS